MKFINYLVYLLLFLIPLQTRLILRPGDGWEYKTVGIFGTEILLWLILLVTVIFYVRHIKAARKIDLRFLFFVVLAAINYWIVPDKWVVVQQLIHVLEAGLVFWFLVGSQINRLSAIYAFLSGLSMQAVLAIYQFLNQSTFASRLLGLTIHNSAIPGASVIENLGGRWLRAYGGLPHPNILAGYLAG